MKTKKQLWLTRVVNSPAYHSGAVVKHNKTIYTIARINYRERFVVLRTASGKTITLKGPKLLKFGFVFTNYTS